MKKLTLEEMAALVVADFNSRSPIKAIGATPKGKLRNLTIIDLRFKPLRNPRRKPLIGSFTYGVHDDGTLERVSIFELHKMKPLEVQSE